ncbi:MAG: hypothetical protein LBR72_04870, partial [Oscillospiraceae bacterium]|nr:hypothetical protein [Oscillospiraceae bacterium]
MEQHYAEETAYLGETLRLLDRQIAAFEADTARERDELRRTLRDTETLFIRDFDDVFTLASVEADVRHAHETYARAATALKRLKIQRDSPYFGRIDLREGGEIETIYIGRFTLMDGESFRGVVYDWRSPVASVYYEDAGAVRYLTPDGERAGFVTLKRQYKIEEGTLLYLFETDVAVRDELLARALAESGGDRLKVIVSTIQREQNDAIRRRADRHLVVTGPAGSGKTSVGMHRLAYLLYNGRDKLTAQNCVVVSASEVFRSYIADILPELGENDVRRVVFDELTAPFLPKGYGGYYEQAAFLAGAAADDPRLAAIRLKYSGEFIAYCRRYFETYEFRLRDFVFRGHVVCSAEAQRGRLYTDGVRWNFPVASARVKAYIEKACDDFFKDH